MKWVFPLGLLNVAEQTLGLVSSPSCIGYSLWELNILHLDFLIEKMYLPPGNLPWDDAQGTALIHQKRFSHYCRCYCCPWWIGMNLHRIIWVFCFEKSRLNSGQQTRYSGLLRTARKCSLLQKGPKESLHIWLFVLLNEGLPRWPSGKESACNVGDVSGRSPGGGMATHSSILA